MDDEERLALQREIFAAIGDDAKMRDIAARNGIDPDLWKFWTAQMQLRDTITEATRPFLEAMLRAAGRVSR